MAIHRRLLTFNQPTNHLTNQLNDRQGTKKTATVLWDRLFAAAEASTGTLTFPKDPELAGAPDNEAAGCDHLVLFLDCDREGENICFEVIHTTRLYLNATELPNAFEGNIFRAHFSRSRCCCAATCAALEPASACACAN